MFKLNVENHTVNKFRLNCCATPNYSPKMSARPRCYNDAHLHTRTYKTAVMAPLNNDIVECKSSKFATPQKSSHDRIIKTSNYVVPANQRTAYASDATNFLWKNGMTFEPRHSGLFASDAAMAHGIRTSNNRILKRKCSNLAYMTRATTNSLKASARLIDAGL